MLIVPRQLNHNAESVQGLASPAETGRILIDYMCERLDVPSLEHLDVLDMRCGARFGESFVNLNVPVVSYTGLDVDRSSSSF